MSIFNPWVILGFVLAMLSAAAGGYSKGQNDEYKRQQIEIAALNAQARETEQNMAKVANTYADTLRKSQNVAKVKETKLRADIATGNLRLSIPAQGSNAPPQIPPLPLEVTAEKQEPNLVDRLMSLPIFSRSQPTETQQSESSTPASKPTKP